MRARARRLPVWNGRKPAGQGLAVTILASVGILVVGSGAGVAADLMTLPGGLTVWLPVVLCAVVCIALASYSYGVTKDVLSPGIVLSAVFAVEYVGRPIYILATNTWGPTALMDDQAVTASTQQLMSHAAWIAFAGLAAFLVAYVVVMQQLNTRAHDWRDVAARARSDTQIRLAGAVTIAIGAAAFIAAGGVYLYLIHTSGGFSAYLSNLATRSSFFGGRAYLTLATLPATLVTLVVMGVVFAGRSERRYATLGVVGMAAFCVLGNFLSGGRAAIILGTFIPVLLVFHYLRKPVRLRVLAGFVAVVLVLFVGVSAFVRQGTFASGSGSRGSALTTALSDIPANVLGDHQAVAFDSLMRLVEARQDGEPLQMGKTYVAIGTYLVPRALWAGKPDGGGNTWFTQTYYPDYYYPDQIETSVSELGELYANFSVIGVLLGFAIIGVLVAWLYCRTFVSRPSLLGVLIYAFTVGNLVALIRGDAYHSVTSEYSGAVLLAILYLLCTRRSNQVAAGLRSAVSRFCGD